LDTMVSLSYRLNNSFPYLFFIFFRGESIFYSTFIYDWFKSFG
jgi:hypothetical protein